MDDFLKNIFSFLASNGVLIWIAFMILTGVFGKKKVTNKNARTRINIPLNIENELLQKIGKMPVNISKGKIGQNISLSEISELLKDPELLKIKLEEEVENATNITGGDRQNLLLKNDSVGNSINFNFSPALTVKTKSRQGYSRTKSLVAGNRSKRGLNPRERYLQIALNGNLNDALQIISKIPLSKRILIEVGTPLIKSSGMEAVRRIKMAIEARSFLGGIKRPYIVADIKTADLGEREVVLAKKAGASAVTCLGVAPIETINAFVSACQKNKIDAMIDMMNVENPREILKKLKDQPRVVIIHRGVDETDSDKSKLIPYYQINQVRGVSKVMVSVAGGDSISEIRSAIFNGADIVVLWKAFYRYNQETEELVKEFLKEIR